MLNDPSCVNYKDVATMTLEMVVTKGGYPQTVSFKHSRGWPATEDWWHYYRSVSRELINLPVERNSRGFWHWSEVFPLTCVLMSFLGRTTCNWFFFETNGRNLMPGGRMGIPNWCGNWIGWSARWRPISWCHHRQGTGWTIAGERTSDFQRKI